MIDYVGLVSHYPLFKKITDPTLALGVDAWQSPQNQRLDKSTKHGCSWLDWNLFSFQLQKRKSCTLPKKGFVISEEN